MIPEKDFWFPLRHEPLLTLDWIRERYRRHEEKTAAHEIDKAVSWLNLAATHAGPEARTLLARASADLKAEATELSAGKLEKGEKLDRILTAGRYVIPVWYSKVSRMAHSKHLHHPDKLPLYGDWPGFQPDVWWYEE